MKLVSIIVITFCGVVVLVGLIIIALQIHRLGNNSRKYKKISKMNEDGQAELPEKLVIVLPISENKVFHSNKVAEDNKAAAESMKEKNNTKQEEKDEKTYYTIGDDDDLETKEISRGNVLNAKQTATQ